MKIIESKRGDYRRRVAVSILMFLLLLNCILLVMRGKLNYPNYWGGVVFAPFAIVIFLLMLLVIWKWDKWKRVRSDKKGRYIQWPRDDWKKW
jgi:hypothetical protein